VIQAGARLLSWNLPRSCKSLLWSVRVDGEKCSTDKGAGGREDHTSLDHLDSLLRTSGYEVATARNGGEALDYTDGPTINLVITDIQMPVMDGFGWCRIFALRRRLLYRFISADATESGKAFSRVRREWI
jgi:Response regulator receiver domain